MPIFKVLLYHYQDSVYIYCFPIQATYFMHCYSKGLKLQSFLFGITEPSLNTSLISVPFTFSALWLFVVGALGFVFICSYSGLLIFATYYDCDPLTTKVRHSNMLFLWFSVTVIISGVPRGGVGCSNPPPPKFRRPSKKSCQTQPECENCLKKLLNLGYQHTKMFGKKGSKILKLRRFTIVLH